MKKLIFILLALIAFSFPAYASLYGWSQEGLIHSKIDGTSEWILATNGKQKEGDLFSGDKAINPKYQNAVFKEKLYFMQDGRLMSWDCEEDNCEQLKVVLAREIISGFGFGGVVKILATDSRLCLAFGGPEYWNFVCSEDGGLFNPIGVSVRAPYGVGVAENKFYKIITDAVGFFQVYSGDSVEGMQPSLKWEDLSRKYLEDIGYLTQPNMACCVEESVGARCSQWSKPCSYFGIDECVSARLTEELINSRCGAPGTPDEQSWNWCFWTLYDEIESGCSDDPGVCREEDCSGWSWDTNWEESDRALTTTCTTGEEIVIDLGVGALKTNTRTAGMEECMGYGRNKIYTSQGVRYWGVVSSGGTFSIAQSAGEGKKLFMIKMGLVSQGGSWEDSVNYYLDISGQEQGCSILSVESLYPQSVGIFSPKGGSVFVNALGSLRDEGCTPIENPYGVVPSFESYYGTENGKSYFVGRVGSAQKIVYHDGGSWGETSLSPNSGKWGVAYGEDDCKTEPNADIDGDGVNGFQDCRAGPDCKDEPKNDDEICDEVVCCKRQLNQENFDYVWRSSVECESVAEKINCNGASRTRICDHPVFAGCSFCVNPNMPFRRCGLDTKCEGVYIDGNGNWAVKAEEMVHGDSALSAVDSWGIRVGFQKLNDKWVWNGLDGPGVIDGRVADYCDTEAFGIAADENQCVISGEGAGGWIDETPSSSSDVGSVSSKKNYYWKPGSGSSDSSCGVLEQLSISFKGKYSDLSKEYYAGGNSVDSEKLSYDCRPDSEAKVGGGSDQFVEDRYGEFGEGSFKAFIDKTKEYSLSTDVNKFRWVSKCVLKDKCADGVNNDKGDDLIKTKYLFTYGMKTEPVVLNPSCCRTHKNYWTGSQMFPYNYEFVYLPEQCVNKGGMSVPIAECTERGISNPGPKTLPSSNEIIVPLTDVDDEDCHNLNRNVRYISSGVPSSAVAAYCKDEDNDNYCGDPSVGSPAQGLFALKSKFFPDCDDVINDDEAQYSYNDNNGNAVRIKYRTPFNNPSSKPLTAAQVHPRFAPIASSKSGIELSTDIELARQMCGFNTDVNCNKNYNDETEGKNIAMLSQGKTPFDYDLSTGVEVQTCSKREGIDYFCQCEFDIAPYMPTWLGGDKGTFWNAFYGDAKTEVAGLVFGTIIVKALIAVPYIGIPVAVLGIGTTVVTSVYSGGYNLIYGNSEKRLSAVGHLIKVPAYFVVFGAGAKKFKNLEASVINNFNQFSAYAGQKISSFSALSAALVKELGFSKKWLNNQQELSDAFWKKTAISMLKWSGYAVNKIKKVCTACKEKAPAGGGCFLAGTKILMEDGSYKNIEDIKVGERVAAYDVENNLPGNATVTETFIRNATSYLKITYEVLDE